MPLDDGIADLVFMITLHHELDNSSLILDESYRILKSGGAIFIVDWKKEDMPQGASSIDQVLSSTGQGAINQIRVWRCIYF